MAEKKNSAYSKQGRRIPAIRVEQEILDCADSYAIKETCKSMGLDKIIDDSFGNLDSIMATMCFQITEGSAMYNCADWLEGNIAKRLFKCAKISSQDISKLMKTLGRADLQTSFFKKYVARFFPNKRGILIDSTALPSAINSSINAFGYASGSIQENVSCLMLVDKNQIYQYTFVL